MYSRLAVLVAAASAVNGQAFKVGQTVKTTTGDLTGKASDWKPEVSEYLGIPFALPPIGNLRWAAPVANKAPGKAVDATKYGSSCLASSSRAPANGTDAVAAMGGASDGQSEDCLFINVWSKPQSGEKKKAVLVWIYGGAFIIGSGSNKGYNGALLAEEGDVVAVNMKYDFFLK
jgi:cholinesterase